MIYEPTYIVDLPSFPFGEEARDKKIFHSEEDALLQWLRLINRSIRTVLFHCDHKTSATACRFYRGAIKLEKGCGVF